VKRGYLHKLSAFTDVAAANFPYLSICNHSCAKMFNTGFSGRTVQAYAMRTIPEGKEITNCYVLDSRAQKHSARKTKLRDTYHFTCACEVCTSPNPDREYVSVKAIRNT